MNIRNLVRLNRTKIGIKMAVALVFMFSLLQIQLTHATPILLWDNANQEQLIGARNVDVMGTLFDVSFIDGSCDSIWSGCDRNKFRFPLKELADAASQALLDQVLIDDFPLITLDSNPWKVRGLEDSDRGWIMTPYAGDSTTIYGSVALNYSSLSTSQDHISFLGTVGWWHTGEWAHYVYARWSVVPEPTSLILLATGLVLLGLYRRKRKQVD